MKKAWKISRGSLMLVVLFALAVGFIAGSSLAPEKVVIRNAGKQTTHIESEKIIETVLPAVDSKGNGVVGRLITTIRPGTGHVLVNVDNVLAQFDTQLSGRAAAKVASNFTSIDLSNIDIIYDIKANASVIEGPSAGAAMATSIILALDDIKPSKNIVITGSIKDNGEIGKVGSIQEKSRAVKEAGATIFLVPEGQSTETTSTRTKNCTESGTLEICSIKYDYGESNISSMLNITIQEVRNISDVIDVYKKEALKSS
jgi:uncharacterized protein